MSTITTEKEEKKVREQSYWGNVFAHLRKNKMAMVSIFVLLLIILGSIFVPIFSPHDIVTTNRDNLRQPPSAEHWLGTDDLGRDQFTRVFYAGRISIGIALTVTVLVSIIGVVLGGIAGFYGKFIDTFIMRFCEIFMSFPFLLACVVVAGLLGNSIFTLIGVLTLLTWPAITRIVRGQILALRDLEYMQACEALGLNDYRRIFRHLLPNVLAYVIVYATISMATVILTETALSFLGLGVAPPTPTWGNMIQEARSPIVLRERWWYWIPPGLGIFISVMCINLLGDGLRDAIDPKMKR